MTYHCDYAYCAAFTHELEGSEWIVAAMPSSNYVKEPSYFHSAEHYRKFCSEHAVSFYNILYYRADGSVEILEGWLI